VQCGLHLCQHSLQCTDVRPGFFEDFNAAIADISHGDENPDPVALTTALEQDASEGLAYLVVMNNNVGFTLLHNLQCMDRKIWLGDPIRSKVVAFGGDIWPGNATPNIFVFDKDKKNLFMRVHLPPAPLLQTIEKYKPALCNEQIYAFVRGASDEKTDAVASIRMI
jgi:hypothetical protein